MDRIGILVSLYFSMHEQIWERLGKTMITVWLLVPGPSYNETGYRMITASLIDKSSPLLDEEGTGLPVTLIIFCKERNRLPISLFAHAPRLRLGKIL
jgi:hypothetical protein